MERGGRTTDADSRTAVERKVFPPDSQPFLSVVTIEPALGFEFLRVIAVEIPSAMHSINIPRRNLPFLNKNRRFAIIAAADGQRCVDLCDSGVLRNDGVEAQRLV